MKTYHVYGEIPPQARVFRIAISRSLDSAIETAKYLRQTLPAVEILSTELPHVPDPEAARHCATSKQEWYEYDDMPVVRSSIDC